MESYSVTVAAGTLCDPAGATWTAPHAWTPEGVSVSGAFTGAHLLHTSVAGCLLNDLYREAEPLGIVVRGARVHASGGFDGTWRSTGVRYGIELDTEAAGVERLLAAVDGAAEIPKALRAGATVERVV